VETLAAILRDTPQPLRQLALGAPHWLERLVHRCLAKDPAARFATTAELARLLQEQGAGEDRGIPTPRHECAGCGRDIGIERRFCPYCGRAQAASCASCGEELDRAAAFCSSCGAQVQAPVIEESTRIAGQSGTEAAAAGGALSGERRLATVVASRIDGFSALVDELDPERRRSVLRAIEEDALSIAEDEGGRLLRFGGGELLMVFGLHGAHEDDARRALRAADRLHAAFERRRDGRGGGSAGGAPLRSRLCTGVSSGMVITEPGEEGELAVTGPAVEAAEHLARRALAGELRVSSETRRLSAATGADSRVLAAATSPSAGEGSGLSVFAGRTAELTALLDAVAAAGRGEGRFLEVIGEAGAGKSRLLHELRRHASSDLYRLAQGRCQSYGAAVPYLPMVEILRGLLEVDESAPPDEQAEAARSALGAFGSDLEPYVDLYLHLLSPSESEGRLPQQLDRKHLRHTLQSALIGLVTLAADRRPLVLLLEDWHWVDEASHEVVRQLAELTSAHPLTVILTRRPEHPVSWPPQASPVTLSLQPIGADSAERIVRSVLGREALDPEVVVALHARSGGNPFFLEELCRSLEEEHRLVKSGGKVRLRGAIESLELPATVHALLRVRLDRVTGLAREVLRRAAVIGREFGAEVLAATLEPGVDLGAALELLRARGLIRQLRVFPEAEYTFQHILVQEAAYESLLRHQRVSLHGQVGRAIERVHAGRLEEHLERLAHHFGEAEAWSKAVRYGRRAARRAADLSHFAEALSMIDRSLAWLERCPPEEAPVEERTALLLDKERLCETLGWRDEQTRLIEELLSLLPPSGDSAERIDVLIRKGELLAQVGQPGEADDVLQEAHRTSRRLGDLLRERNSLRGLAFLRWHEQRLNEVVELLREALELDRRLQDRRAEVQDLANLGTTLRRLDQPAEALAVLGEARELNREVKDALRETNILYMLSWVYRSLGDDAKARECLVPGTGLGGETAIERPYQMIALANLALEHGQVDEALEFLRQSVESCRKSRYRAGLAHSLRSLAETLIGLGRTAEGLAAALEAAELFAQLGEAASELRLRAICAPILERFDRAAAARQYQRLVELSRLAGRADLEVEGLLGVARDEASGGRLEPARQRLLAALERCAARGTAEPSVHQRLEELGGDVLNGLGIVEWRLERFDDALARYREALEHFQQRGDRKHQGLMLNSIGATLRRLGRAGEATAVLLKAETVHRESGEELLRGHASALLGDLERDAGRTVEARRWYEQSLEIRCAIGDQTGEAWMLLRLAQVAAEDGAREQAREQLAGATALADRLGDETIAGECASLERTLGESDA
jgi:predicted ATPase